MPTGSPRPRRRITKLAVGAAVAGLAFGGLIVGGGSPASAGTICAFEENTAIFSCNIDEGGGYFHYINNLGTSIHYYNP